MVTRYLYNYLPGDHWPKFPIVSLILDATEHKFKGLHMLMTDVFYLFFFVVLFVLEIP